MLPPTLRKRIFLFAVRRDTPLREIFSIFTSCAEYERTQVYDPGSSHYFKKVQLYEEYEICYERREYGIDAWRAVLYFLHRKGFSLDLNGETIDLKFSEEEFVR